MARSRGRLVVATAVLAVVVGAVGAGASWALTRDGGSAASPSPCAARGLPVGAGVQHQRHGRTQATACVDGTNKADTTVTASYTPSKRQGYVIYQGQPGNTTPPGYVGADTQNGLTIVGCDTGTYNPNAKDEWNQSPNSKNNNAQIAVGTDEFTAPTGPIGPGDPCSPFVPHTPPGKSCGSPQNRHPAVTTPREVPLQAYAGDSPRATAQNHTVQVGLTGDFGDAKGASGFLQVTAGPGKKTLPRGNVATGGNSRGGGGTVAVGNDGKETDDPFTPKRSPVVVCQD